MKYRIFVTRRARLDMLSAYRYIADTLQNSNEERRVYIVRLLYSRRNWTSLVISKDTLD